jgi:hypothetical protein
MGNEEWYLEATSEVEDDKSNPALWAKVMALAEGNQENAKFQYVKIRVEQLARKTACEFDLKYMPIAEFSRITLIPENKTIQMVRDGFYAGLSRDNEWFISKEELDKEEQAATKKPKVSPALKTSGNVTIPVDDFAELEGVTPEKAVEMIQKDFYQGQLVDGEWYVAYSELSSPDTGNTFSFDNLGIWRKSYLLLNWIALLALSWIIVLTPGEPGPEAFIFLFVVWPYTIWLHLAIVGRKVIQLRWLCGLTAIPLMNPVGAIIIWVIGSTSKQSKQQG